MKEERMKILDMLSEGKITADEAKVLIDAVSASPYRQYSFDSEDFERKVRVFSQNVECFAKDCGSKMEDVFSCMEPKIRKATKVVVEKTASIVDDISRSLNESIKKFEDCECGCGCNDDECECTCDCECDENCDENCECECHDNEKCCCECEDDKPAEN